jgi:hypothetical protein
VQVLIRLPKLQNKLHRHRLDQNQTGKNAQSVVIEDPNQMRALMTDEGV